NTAVGTQSLEQLQAEQQLLALNVKVVELLNQGRWQDALPLAQQAVALGQKIGEQHPEDTGSLSKLATIYRPMNRSAEALPMAQKAVQLQEQRDKRHRSYPVLVNNLGLIYLDLRQYDKALATLRQALELSEKLGEPAPVYASRQMNLAKVYG